MFSSFSIWGNFTTAKLRFFVLPRDLWTIRVLLKALAHLTLQPGNRDRFQVGETECRPGRNLSSETTGRVADPGWGTRTLEAVAFYPDPDHAWDGKTR